MFFFPEYSLTYPIEYIETAKAAIEMARMKNAESLSTKNPKFKNDVTDGLKLKVSPKITDNENINPKMDAMEALKKEA